MISTDAFADTFGAVPPGDTDAVRKIAILAVRNGFAVVLDKPGQKVPLCPLTARAAKQADREVQETARSAGDGNWQRRRHACGLNHAFTDAAQIARVIKRLTDHGVVPNLGVEVGRSRMVVVDVDTAGEKDAFLAEWTNQSGRDMTGMVPTVKSPGAKIDGRWVHKDGGHFWFSVPAGTELPEGGGVLKGEGGWAVLWRGKQVLVPPSVRAEGEYRLVGQAAPLPGWLAEFIEAGARRQADRRSTAVLEARTGGGISAWAADLSWSEILQADEWTDTGKADNCGCPVWTAPGDHASPKSATAHEPGCSVYTTDGGQAPIHIWTDNIPECAEDAVKALGRTFSKLNYMTYRFYGGDRGRALGGLGISDDLLDDRGAFDRVDDASAGSEATARDCRPIEPPAASITDEDEDDDGGLDDFGLPSGDGGSAAPAGGASKEAVRNPTLLPESFWSSRPELDHVRQAAWSRDVGADAVLYAALVRISSFLPGDLKVDTGIGDRRSLNLNLFAAMIGGPSDGKTSSAGLAPSLLPVPPALRNGTDGEVRYHDEASIGTGEGLIESFMGEVDVVVGENQNGTEKTAKRRRQVRNNASFYVDEGKTLTSLMVHREGSTLGQTIRTAWYGKKTGQMNATAERTRNIENYSLGLLIGYQPETALPLLEGADEGTPQRFVWTRADLTRNPEEEPEDPGPLWEPETLPKLLGMDPADNDDGHYLLGDRSETAIVLSPALKARIKADRKAARKDRPETLDGHRPTSLIKLSGLLAIMAGRTEITEDDWTLALVMWGVSCAVRTVLVTWAGSTQKKKTAERTEARVTEAVAVKEAVAMSSDGRARVARRLHRVITQKGAMTPGALKKDLGRDKPLFPGAYELAMASGWLIEEDGNVALGSEAP
jgi:hypothetical protein